MRVWWGRYRRRCGGEVLMPVLLEFRFSEVCEGGARCCLSPLEAHRKSLWKFWPLQKSQTFLQFLFDTLPAHHPFCTLSILDGPWGVLYIHSRQHAVVCVKSCAAKFENWEHGTCIFACQLAETTHTNKQQHTYGDIRVTYGQTLVTSTYQTDLHYLRNSWWTLSNKFWQKLFTKTKLFCPL